MQNAECRIALAVVFIPFVLWATVALGATSGEVRVSVDAGQVVRTVDARLFGINTAIWDGLLDTAETVSALRELGVQALRFPGGSLSDEYHWALNATSTNGGTCPTSFSNLLLIQAISYQVGEHLGRVRLGQIENARLRRHTGVNNLRAVAAGDDDLQARLQGLQLLC